MTTSPSELRFSHLEIVTDRVEHFHNQVELVRLFQRTRMHVSPQETFWALAYGIDLGVAHIFEVNRGQYALVELHVPSLLAGVLVSGVERFVLAHNHPTTDPEPTDADIAVTREVMKAANTVRLHFEDHLILCPDESYYSFNDAGLLVPAKNSPYRVKAAA